MIIIQNKEAKMITKEKTVPFFGTKEQEKELVNSIDELKHEKGSLIPILQKASRHLWIFTYRSTNYSF